MAEAPGVTFRPPRLLGVSVGAILTLGVWAMAILIARRSLSEGFSAITLLAWVCVLALAGGGLLLAYWTFGCLRLCYIVDRGVLAIQWGSSRIVVPLGQVKRLIPGYLLSPPQLRGVSWPGYHVGLGRAGPLGEVLFFSTHRSPREILYLITPARSYAISGQDLEGLATKLQEQLGVEGRAEGPGGPGMTGAAGKPHWQRSDTVLPSLFPRGFAARAWATRLRIPLLSPRGGRARASATGPGKDLAPPDIPGPPELTAPADMPGPPGLTAPADMPNPPGPGLPRSRRSAVADGMALPGMPDLSRPTGTPRSRARRPLPMALLRFSRRDGPALALAILVACLAGGLFLLRALSPELPIHVPATALALGVANLAAAYVLYRWDAPVAWLLLMGAMGLQGMAWAAAVMAIG